ncbi:MAG: Tim44 domain-containing protein [Ottowia sp.]|nr:Tim44 domain-containing protein [Ottowia sp.]
MKSFWHKRVMLACLVATLALASGFADAKRMGGGRSMGKQSNNVTQQRQPSQAQQQPSTAPAPAQAAPGRNWGGMLGGLAAGLGLGMLFSHLGGAGMMGGLGNILMIAALAMLGVWVFRKLRGQSAPSSPYAASTGSTNAPLRAVQPELGAAPIYSSPSAFSTAPNSFSSGANATASVASSPATWTIPADFDVDNFIRHAKVYFVRLQAAWDSANADDIREFTSPEMFAEIYADLSERGSATNKTDVVTLDAQLLGIEQTGNYYLASVRFSGMLREAQAAAPESFAEVWNLSKPVSGSGGWVLSGIQQLQ